MAPPLEAPPAPEAEESSAPPPPSDARSDLMAAIRDLGNRARLKKVKRDEAGNPINDGRLVCRFALRAVLTPPA